MTAFLRAVRLLAVFLVGGLHAADREVRQVFPVGPNPSLLIDTNQGEILVEESDRDEISVAIAVDAVAENDAAAERLLKNVQVAMDSRDNRVSIVVRNLGERGIRFIWNEDERADVIFRVTVPRRCDVEVRAIDAQVTIGNLIGRMKVRVENGRAFLRRIEGSVDVVVDFGDLILSRCSGAVNAKILRGNMRLGPVGGRADLNNATGNIEVMVVRHSLEAKAQAGDIRVGFAPGLAADSRVRVSGGSIVADFAAATACDLDAGATFGRVTSKLPLAIDPGGEGERSLRGRLNGGGPRIELRASGGSVTLGTGLEWLDENG